MPRGRARTLLRRGGLIAALIGLAVSSPAWSASGTLSGQSMPRTWLDWRSAETEHFVFHYPSAYREWTLALAERMEGVRTQVGEVIGFVPSRRVHVIVDDPANDANGYAFTPLDAPTIVLWPVSPDPRSSIGDYAVWGELLATHEFAHIAHLTRPSRNRWQKFARSLSPVPLGPIATKAPRWAIEGYATYVEGRVTGSGRPNHAWRAAILRQFALEGRLPSYGQLGSTSGWLAGEFAYLAGSAFLEWLARREGDASLVALWRRLTAKTDRSFEAAFAGLYGGSPAELYGRFTVELTADAVELARQLAASRLVEGTLVQRLVRSTGDPAVSPDGRFVALTVRRTDAPSRLVVWRTADEPDTLLAQRQAAQLRRDPEDVPDRAFQPPPKHEVISLVADDGAPYETPRWFADNRRLLLTRRVPTMDGTVRSDLFVWNAEDGALSRLTTGAALRDADPSADGRWAAAVRCQKGWCDLVRIDLTTRAVRVLRAGSVTRNYYRPRVSRRTGEIVVAEQLGDRWRVARISPDGSTLSYADPDDGVNRYDATFDVDGVTILATSERGGFANIERLAPAGGASVPITRVTGAAVSAEVAPDGAVWFLNMRASGYDLRRVAADSAQSLSALPLPTLADSFSSVLPRRRRPVDPDSVARPALGARPEERRYGFGPSRYRYLPSATTGFGGTTATLALIRSDPVGRLGLSVIGAAGSAALPEGGAVTAIARVRQTKITLSGWLSHEAPSRELPSALGLGLDLPRAGGALLLDRLRVGVSSDITATLGFLAERQRPRYKLDATRVAGLAAFTGTLRQADEQVRFLVQLHGLGEFGSTAEGSYARHRSALSFGSARGRRSPATIRVDFGTVGGGAGSPRESFVVGGFRSPLIDPILDARRVDAPAYPVGSVAGLTFASFRLSAPVEPIELFYSAHTTDFYANQLRSFGAELRQRVPAIPALGTPGVDLLTGFAKALDAPVRDNWRYYVSLGVRP